MSDGEDDEYVCCLDEVLIHIDYAPTEDVVEVVRCKDCKYNDDGNCDVIRETLNGDLIGVTLRCSDDFYCSYGKRRE